MTVINPNAISEDEQVIIKDGAKNAIEGPMIFTEEGQMAIEAFGMQIAFARWSSSARDGLGGWVAIKGVKIVGHQAPLDLMAFDVVPKQHFGSNPT